MICPTCRGRQFVSLGGADEDEGAGHQPCPDCIGGIASCCDSTVERLQEHAREQGREEEREKAAQYLEAEARKHDEAAADIERETADEEGIDEEARMHRFDAESLRRHAAAIRGLKMTDTQDEIWARVKAHREREEKLKAHPLGALFLAYERERSIAAGLDIQIELSEWASKKLLDKSKAAADRLSEARDALIEAILQ